MAPCSGCGGGKGRTVTNVRATTAPARRAVSRQPGNTANLPDENFVLVQLQDGRRGDHPIVGLVTKQSYGHHQDGDRFLMYRADVFTVNERTGQVSLVNKDIQPAQERPVEPPQAEHVDLPAPDPLAGVQPPQEDEPSWGWKDEEETIHPSLAPFDLQLLPGVGPSRARQLEAAGLTDPETILDAGVSGLKKAGLTNAVAAAIIEYLSAK